MFGCDSMCTHFANVVSKNAGKAVYREVMWEQLSSPLDCH